MNRYGNLKEKILSDENLILAEQNARKGKGNTYGIKRFDRRDDLTLDKIKQSLSDLTYRTSNYHIFKIYEPKERIIHQLPYYPDRIVHHCLMNVLEPIFVKWFIKNTYSCIKNRGIHNMVKDVEKDLKRYDNNWCLKLDIRKFYPSINQKILFEQIKTKIKCKWLIQVLEEIIKSSSVGVPIGNYLSQFFANIYLNKIDHWIKEVLKVKCYYRYCDDIVIFGNNKTTLYKIYRLISQKLSFIQLKLKHYRLFQINDGVDFAGYVFKKQCTLIRKTIKVKFKRAAKKYSKCGRIRYKRQISSYYGWLIHCDAIHLLKTNINDLYYEFKKHYFKNCGVRTCKLGRRRKATTVR